MPWLIVSIRVPFQLNVLTLAEWPAITGCKVFTRLLVCYELVLVRRLLKERDGAGLEGMGFSHTGGPQRSRCSMSLGRF
jgi:hypothetical protein